MVGRFFRKLIYNKDKSAIRPTQKVVGKSLCALVGREIAEALRLPNAQNYKGQCWRSTAAALLANEGLNANEIKRKTINI